MTAPARLMRGAVCERIVLERGSTLTVRLGDRLLPVLVTDLAASPAGEIRAVLQGTVQPARGNDRRAA